MKELEVYIQNEESFSLISSELPLIYNLNILENIALIKEVHERMQIKQAEYLASEALAQISLENIALKRQNQCSIMEIFYVMVIRASMAKEKTIFIKTPNKLIGNLKNIDIALKRVSLLKLEKEIVILDTEDNKNFYKGSLCNIIE